MDDNVITADYAEKPLAIASTVDAVKDLKQALTETGIEMSVKSFMVASFSRACAQGVPN